MKKYFFVQLIVVLFCIGGAVQSQTPVIFSNPGGPGTNGNNGSGTTVDITDLSVPFDGYSCLVLLAVGIWYVGVYKGAVGIRGGWNRYEL